jgi:hypothetical protein
LPIPAAPPGEAIDLASVRVVYTSGEESATFDQVASVADCFDAEAFYIAGGGSIVLCPAACQVVQADIAAKVEVLFDCLAVTR